MDEYRRYGRWLKRAAWVLALYVFAAWLFMGLPPGESLSNPSLVVSQLRPFMLQALILVFFIILQFGALFWFLSRGNDYVIYPNEYDTSFDDVRGQPAAVESTKEVLRVFEGFKDFKQMGGYPPHGILFEGPPGTGKTLMAKAIAGASGVPFLFATGSGFANMFIGIGNLKVRKLFKKARVMSDKYGGAVIFIDEIDAVGSRGAVTTDRSGDRLGHQGLAGPRRALEQDPVGRVAPHLLEVLETLEDPQDLLRGLHGGWLAADVVERRVVLVRVDHVVVAASQEPEQRDELQEDERHQDQRLQHEGAQCPEDRLRVAERLRRREPHEQPREEDVGREQPQAAPQPPAVPSVLFHADLQTPGLTGDRMSLRPVAPKEEVSG